MDFHKHGEMKAQAFGRWWKRVVVHTDNLMRLADAFTPVREDFLS